MAGKLAAHARVHAPWRRTLPRRAVYREVQGVGLWLPWSHRLPDYVAVSDLYGRNLVELAARLDSDDPQRCVQIIDVGANVGDSTKQIVARTPAEILAIEADPFYLGYLRRNTADTPSVTVAPLLLTVEQDIDAGWVPTRHGGTTQFRQASASDPTDVPTVAVADLPARFPAFDAVRLIKSDTDGYDSTLVPRLASVFAATTPVLFFEFDPRLTRDVGRGDAFDVWAALTDLGYGEVGIWDNAGGFASLVDCAAAPDTCAGLLDRHSYLDVAVVHGADASGREALHAAIAHTSGAETQ